MKRWLALALLFLLIVAGCQPKPAPVYRATAKVARTLDWWEGKSALYGLSIEGTPPSYYGFQSTRYWGTYFKNPQSTPSTLAFYVVLKLDGYDYTASTVDTFFNSEKQYIDWITTNKPSSIFAISNEPNFGPPATPAVYAYAIELYGDYIKARDPGAQIMTGGILLDECYKYPNHEWVQWVQEFMALAPPVDIWGINPYAYCPDTAQCAQTTIAEIIEFRELVGPDKAIWLLEYGNYRTKPIGDIVSIMGDIQGWLDYNHSAYGIDRWFWFMGLNRCDYPWDACNSGLFNMPLSRTSATVVGDAYQTRFRVFVDSPSYQRDTSRVRGSMTNPYSSRLEAQRKAAAGAEIYDFQQGAVVGVVPIHRMYIPTWLRWPQ